ncbi:MAG TPA: FliM/FliN family flagellar motor switch protein [Methylomirabilota bacterium]|nr:FliM/FliN family flagellar motor switch protein [Methylomirabilota bacterium]
MRKILTQDEIDKLFSSAQQSRQGPGAGSGRRIVRCDLGKSSTLSSDQVRIVTYLHESFARRLGSSLGAYLRVAFEMNLVSAEQITYSEYLSRLPELTYLASLHIMPIDARAAIHADLSLVFPIVDLVLGGSGLDPIDPRDLTEIEEQIFETVVGVIARDLQITWAPVLEIEIQFEQRQQQAQAQGLMLQNEKILCLSFETRLSEARGTISLAFPAVVANALLRKLSVQWSFSTRIPSRDSRRRIRERLLGSQFDVQLSLPGSPLPIRDLLSLKAGSVLMLPKRAQEPVHMTVAGLPMFLAYPVRQGTQKGARVERRLSLTDPATKESQ